MELVEPALFWASTVVAVLTTCATVWISRQATDWRHRALIAERERDAAIHARDRALAALIQAGAHIARARMVREGGGQ